jgi:hypothetical protein
MQKILEKDIQHACLELLRYKGYFVWKQNNAGIMKPNGSYIPSTIPGIADIIGLSPKGRFVAIEVKRPGGIVTELQRGFIRCVSANNGLAGVVHSIDEMQSTLSEWEKML